MTDTSSSSSVVAAATATAAPDLLAVVNRALDDAGFQSETARIGDLTRQAVPHDPQWPTMIAELLAD